MVLKRQKAACQAIKASSPIDGLDAIITATRREATGSLDRPDEDWLPNDFECAQRKLDRPLAPKILILIRPNPTRNQNHARDGCSR